MGVIGEKKKRAFASVQRGWVEIDRWLEWCLLFQSWGFLWGNDLCCDRQCYVIFAPFGFDLNVVLGFYVWFFICDYMIVLFWFELLCFMGYDLTISLANFLDLYRLL